MSFRGFVLYIPKLHVEGMALFPFILVKRTPCGPVLLNHERIHLRQQIELGIVLFYILYLLEYAVRLAIYGNHLRAYMNISFEKEAYMNERNPDYLSTRSWFASFRYFR